MGSSLPNSVWERTCLRRNAAAKGRRGRAFQLCFAGVATELPGQRHSQTEFGNEGLKAQQPFVKQLPEVNRPVLAA
jgi:hypothetical protein